MILNMYAILDVKAEAYGNPMFLANDGMATRALAGAVMDPDSQLCKHSEDFNLYRMGQWDNISGAFTVPDHPEFIIAALSVKHHAVEQEAGNHADIS